MAIAMPMFCVFAVLLLAGASVGAAEGESLHFRGRKLLTQCGSQCYTADGSTPFCCDGHGGCSNDIQSVGPKGQLCSDGYNFQEAAGATTTANGNVQQLGSVDGDPHVHVNGLSYDFSGSPGSSYCMTTDYGLQVNARFVGEDQSVEGAGTSTWMEAIALIWVDSEQKEHHLIASINQAKDWETEDVFTFDFDGTTVDAISSKDFSQTWTSPSGSVTIFRPVDVASAVDIRIEDLIDIHMTSTFDERIARHPAGKYINFEMRSLMATPNIHGVMGQMLQDHAVERRARLKLGEAHRELVEGDDDSLYATSSITQTDCSFSRFRVSEAPAAANLKAHSFSNQEAVISFPKTVT